MILNIPGSTFARWYHRYVAAARNPDLPAVDATGLSEPESHWQRRAMDRAMGEARTKALARSSKFLTTALELLEETGSVEFTLQNVVDRSELSLRAFYQHFGSKDELLLALFEELLRQFVDDIEADISTIDDPFDRLEAYIRGFLGRSHESLPVGGRAWTIYQLRLAADQPEEYVRAFGRQTDLLASIVRHGLERDVFRTDIGAQALTHLLNSTIVSAAQMDVLDIQSTGRPTPDDVWAWCRKAVSTPAN